jgi:hypothetical protein
MAKGGNNPIYYKDLVQADDSVLNLIQQLDQLSDSFMNKSNNIKKEAKEILTMIKETSGATEKGRASTKAAATETDKLAKARKDLKFAESDLQKQIQELNAAKNEQVAFNKLAIKLANSEHGSYNALSAQYSINKRILNGLSKEYRENTKDGRELVETTKDIYEEMKRLQEATGKNQLNVGNYKELKEGIEGYSESLLNSMGIQGEFASSLLKMAESRQGQQALFKAIGEGIANLGKSLLMLLTNPVFLAIAGIAGTGAAVKWWYDYNVGLMEATRLTQQFTGLAGNDLKAFRNEVQATADMFDSDFKDVLISTNAVAKQFGISQSEALQAVKDGFLAGADANGEYLENLKEYPAYFKEAGLSAREFIAITTQGNKSGIYSDKAIDTIKEGNIRIREMTKATADALTGIGINYKQVQKDLQSGSKTTFDVMQEVSKKLNELPASSAAVGTAIADIFGGPGEDAGLEYLKTLKDIDTNLDNVKGKAGEVAKAQEEQLNAQIELENTISALFDKTGGSFEVMLANAKTFVLNGINAIIKGFVDIINYGIKMYNDSIAFRAIIQSIILTYQNQFTVVKELFMFVIEQAKVIGKALHGAFTLNFSEISEAWSKGMSNMKTFGTNIYKGLKQNVNNAIDQVKNGKLKPIEIPVLAKPVGGTATIPGGGKSTPIANYDKKEKDKSKDLAKEAEEIRKKNLELQRKYEDALTNLIEDEFAKRREQLRISYERSVKDLQYQLANDKKLNADGRAAINNLLIAMQKQYNIDIQKVNADNYLAELQLQKEGIQARLDAVKKGSDEEFALRLELLEKEREMEKEANKTRPEGQRKSEVDIDRTFNARRNNILDEQNQLRLLQFDQQQQAAQAEFDLLRTTEEQKTQFRLAAEKARLMKILELNETMNNKLSDEQVKAIKYTMAKIDQEMAQSKRKDKKDIWGIIGIKLDDDQKQAISDSVSFAIDGLRQILDAKIQMAEQAIQAADKEAETAKTRLDQEIEARNNGYANDVLLAQKELENAKKNQDKANRDKAKAVKQQQMLDTVTQASSLVTASANIWASLSGIPIVGTALALAAIGVMWGSFAISKTKAAQMTKQGESESYGEGTIEMLEGGSHQSGNDIDLGRKKDGTKRRAEGGEFFAVINKRNSRRYRGIIPSLINSLNDGTFHEKYSTAYDDGGITVDVNNNNPDMDQIKSDVSAMRKNSERRTIIGSNGEIIEVYKNLKRKIK